MKRLFTLLLLWACLLPAVTSAEIILWEDEGGQVILNDEGDIDFVPTPGASARPTPRQTPSPTPPPTPLPAPDKTLQYGDSGDDVLAAQERLTDLGYYHGLCSGDYLDGTQSAVRRFQKYNDMRETGKLDARTWERLFSAAAVHRDGSTPYATPSPVPVLTPTPTPEPFTFSRTVKYGDSGDLVSAIQTRLAELGFYEKRVSGGYYEVTREAVRAFQEHNGLAVDGIAGQDTQQMLFSADAVPASATPRPSPTPAPAKYKLMVDVVNQSTRAYTYDENGEYTVLVREMICSTGTSSNPTPLGTTIMPKKRARWGYFPQWDSHAQYLTRIDSANAFHSVLYSAADERTLSTKSFEALGTPASHGCVRLYVSDAKWIYDNCEEGTIITVYEGEYDPEYTMTLKRTLNTQTLRENLLPDPTPTPEYSRENWPTEYRTLSRGKTGEDVYMLQVRLAELGYYQGSITGGYYGGTIQAVEDFQRDHGLAVDGAAGTATQSLLFSSAVDPQPEETPLPSLSPGLTPSPEAAGTPAPGASPLASSPAAASTPAPTKDPSTYRPLADSVG